MSAHRHCWKMVPVPLPWASLDFSVKRFLFSVLSIFCNFFWQGQFYGVTLEYRSNAAESIVEELSNVKSVVMLVFRDAKIPDDELNAWEFWHQVRMYTCTVEFGSGSVWRLMWIQDLDPLYNQCGSTSLSWTQWLFDGVSNNWFNAIIGRADLGTRKNFIFATT